ncbi:probable glutathione S-transferase [Diospyros lotus]|uniref:probable glutathione S-transferase n=1 Tax=Diospyros lotus TaxID=55363 RepID=UPI0022549EFD|nr:probable glutathione S-transferase [Diospyros lotus]
MSKVKLFRTWSSPYALRIVWALELKGIDYETIFEDLSNKSQLLLQYNPVHKKVPVLVHNGKAISESLVIIEYIEDTWKDTPLLPEDPYEKATARFWEKFNDDKLSPSIWQVFVTQGKEQEEAIPAATENLSFIEEDLKGKKFFGGQTIGLIDITIGWIANLISVFIEITGIKLIGADKFPLLFGWMQNFSDVPVIKESWPPHDKLVIKFRAIRESYLSADVPK